MFGINLNHKFLALFTAFMITLQLYPQSDGDYRSRNSGTWNSNNTWQVRSGGSWIDCSPGDYPGASTGAGTVNILNNHTITVSADVPNSIGELRIDGGNRDSYLEFNASQSLTVSGLTYLNSNSNNDYKAVHVDAGIFHTGSVEAYSSGNSRDAYIRISTGEVTVDGDITLNGDGRRTYIQFTGDGDLYVGGAITGGIITSTAGGSTSQPPTSGTVTYNGTSAQNIGPYTYYNLKTDNSSGLTLTSDITVNNIITLSSGNITTGSNTLIHANSTSTDLVYSAGTIIGYLRRDIDVPSGTEYLFPVGSATNYNPLKITFTNISAGELTVYFQSADIGTAGLPLTDGAIQITDRHSTGYWTLVASGGLASTDYDVNLNYTGFVGVNSGSRIIKRTAGGNLTVDGTHGSVSSPEITRTGLNGISTVSTDLGIGRSGLSITSQPDDYSGCAPAYTITAIGPPPLSYQWQEDSGSGFADITDGGMYSGATTNTLTITGATEAMTGYLYRCIVTDGGSNSETSTSASFTYSLPDVSLGYNYYMDITLDPASGSDDLTDFPVLISFTSSNLISESNGGNVASDNGYDIYFTDENNSKLDHELEYYDPVNGEYIGWVRIPVLPNSSTTTIRIHYGNSTATTDPSTDAVWASNYKAVWHLHGNDYSDATQYSNDGTNNATTDVTGRIAGGKGFNGSTSYIQVPTNGFVPNDNNQTISIWANYSTTPIGNRNLISFQNATASSAIQLGFRGGNAVAWKWGGAILADAGPAPSTNTWHYYVYTYDGTNSRLYIDGAELDNSTVAPQTALPSEGNIGRYNNGEYIAADLDEPRFSMSPKSAGWILTEYNNQNNPAGFISVGTVTDNSVLATIGVCSTTFTLDQGYPTGGIYSGTGVSGTNFNASVAGVGTHSITYTYTDGDGCTNYASKDIIVTAIPAAPVASDTECCITNIADLEATGTNLKWYSDAALTNLVGTGTPFATGETTAGVYTYYVTQTVNDCESTATTVNLIIHNSISIDVQPTAQLICEGDNAAFSVAASGYNLSYQWQEDSGSGFANITDGGVYSGSTTSVLTLTDPGIALDGNLYQCVISGPCGVSPLTTNSVSLTVTPRPVATFIYSGSPYCPNETNPFPTFTGGGIAGTFSSTPGLVFVSTSTGEVDLAGSTPGTYTVTNTIAPTGGCGEVIETSPITIIEGLVWTGSADTDWNNISNWSCGYIPTISTPVQIPDVPNKPVLSTGAVATVSDLTIDNNASLTISGNTIQISGTITNNGTFDVSAATVEMNGSAAQVINANTFYNNSVKDLVINNASGVTLGAELNLTEILYPQSGNLAAAGYLTLVSTASGTALIDGSGSGTVSGNINMQRYLPVGFGYKYFSSPFQAATVSEFGDDMDLTFWFPTFYEYDESRTTSGWVDYSDPAGVLEPMHGYAVNFGNVSDPNTVDVTGEVNNGPLSLTIYNNNNTYTLGMNLVGNPYPSPIDWDAAAGWTKTNIDDAVYYFKASATDEYGGTYSSYINGVSSDGIVSNIIPSMQGFFVHVSDGAYPVTGTLGMNNNIRVNDMTQEFSKSAAAKTGFAKSVPLIRLVTEFEDDTASTDPMVIYFHDQATVSFDRKLDALKLLNTDFNVSNLYATVEGDKKLSINALPSEIEMPVSIPLGLKINRNGNIKFFLLDIDSYFSNLNLSLYDNLTDLRQGLNNDSLYTVTLETGEYHNRFFLEIMNVATDIHEPLADDYLFDIYASHKILKTNIYAVDGKEGILSVFNLTGQIVFKQIIRQPGYYEFNAPVLSGVYIINYTSGARTGSRKIIIGN